MKKTIFARVSLVVIILVALIMMTSVVWADADEPVEKPSQKADPVKEQVDCRVCYPACVWKMLGCKCIRQIQ